MEIAELLGHFSNEELADALYAARLPVAGTKSERIARLVEAAGPSGIDARTLLDCFSGDALRAACDCAGLRSGRKSEMIDSLVSLLGALGTASSASSAVSQPPREYLSPTKDAVLQCLRELRVPSRALKSEGDVEEVVAPHLAPRFQAVCQQYSIGGILGLKIDLDIDDGKVGVELKLSDSILGNANEFHRLIGQAIYYDHRRYRGNLIVWVVGRRGDADDPLLRDVFSILEAYRISCVCLTTA